MNKFKKNILYNMLYQILVLIVPLVTTPYISRVLGDKGLGTFSYVNSVVYYFFIFITLGLANYGNRAIAKCKNDDNDRSSTFWAIYKMQLAIGLVVISLFTIYLFVFVEEQFFLYFCTYIFYLIGACIDINWFFFGMEDFKFTTIRNSIIKILTIIFVFVFVKGDNALLNYCLLVSISTLLSNLLLWSKLFKYVKYKKNTFKECFSHLKPNLILFIPIIAISIYRVMDKIMIKELSSIAQVGLYENADRVITISLTAFSAISTVMMPAVTNMINEKKLDEINIISRDIMQITNFFSIAMVFGLIAIAVEFSELYFGESFIESGYLLIGLSPIIFLSAWKTILRSQYIIPFEKDRSYVISLVISAAINLIINFIFIPLYGARGAVIGTFVAEFIGFIIQTYVASKGIKISVMVKDAVIFIIPAIMMGLSSHYLLNILPYNLLSIVLVILLAFIIYTLLVVLSFMIFDKQRLNYIRNNILKKYKKRRI